MKQYRGNRKPFCYALFTEADRQEAEAVLGELEKHRIHSAFSARRSADCIMRAAVVLLFLSPEAVSDKAVQEGVAEATSAGKTVLTVFLKETALTPGLSMQLGQTQGIFNLLSTHASRAMQGRGGPCPPGRLHAEIQGCGSGGQAHRRAA